MATLAVAFPTKIFVFLVRKELILKRIKLFDGNQKIRIIQLIMGKLR